MKLLVVTDTATGRQIGQTLPVPDAASVGQIRVGKAVLAEPGIARTPDGIGAINVAPARTATTLLVGTGPADAQTFTVPSSVDAFTIQFRPSATPPVAPEVAKRQGWSLLLEDQFDGPLDLDPWTIYDQSTYGSGNNELAALLARNVFTENGVLVIQAKREDVTVEGKPYHFTSGFVSTREVGRYFPGYLYVEARARPPHGQGVWPAFWLRHRKGATSPDGAEFDPFELFHIADIDRARGTFHAAGSKVKEATAPLEKPTLTPGWHRFFGWIEPASGGARVVAGVDDTIGLDVTLTDPKHLKWLTTADRLHTWDLALNLAIGGDWVGDPDGPLGNCARREYRKSGTMRAGLPPERAGRLGEVAPANFSPPLRYEIDYVRVWGPTGA